MKIVFKETPTFKSEYKRLCKKYASIPNDIEKLKKEINANPDIGDRITGSVKKIRFSIASKNKGKSGGGRMITVEALVGIMKKEVVLVFMYDKSEYKSISDAFIKLIVANELKEK